MLGVAVAMVGSLSLLAADGTGSPHVLVAAAEALVQRDQAEAAQVVIRAALASPVLTRTERARLRLADAVRLSNANDEAGAKKQIDDALNLDPAVSFAFPVKEQLQVLLEDLRSMHPPPEIPQPTAPAAAQRERPATSLLRVVDLLGSGGLYDAADSVLQLGWHYGPFRAEDEGALMARRGVVKVNLFDDEEAQRAFHRALELDREAKLPEWAPPKTARQFEDMRAALPPPPLPPPPPPPPSPPPVEVKATPPMEKPSPPAPQVAKTTPLPPPPPPVKKAPANVQAKSPPMPAAKPSPGTRVTPAKSSNPVTKARGLDLASLMPRRPWAWVTFGGSALEVAGGLLYLLAWRQYDLLSTHSPTITDERETANVGRGLQVGAAVLAGAGAAALLTGLTLSLFEGPATLHASVQVTPGRVAFGLSGVLP